MTDPIEPVEPETPEPVEPVEGDDDTPVEGEEALGDPGKRALDATKAKLRVARQRTRALEVQLAQATAPKEGELTPEQIREQIRAEVRADANKVIVAARVEAAAARLLQNPSDAAAFLDLTEFEVDANGHVDADEITSALNDLIAERPYLAITETPQRGNKRVPEVPADPANKPSTPVSHAERIKAAQAAGDMEAVIALQNDLLYPQK